MKITYGFLFSIRGFVSIGFVESLILGILITKCPVILDRSAAESVVFTSSGKTNCRIYKPSRIIQKFCLENSYLSFNSNSNISRLNINIKK